MLFFFEILSLATIVLTAILANRKNRWKNEHVSPSRAQPPRLGSELSPTPQYYKLYECIRFYLTVVNRSYLVAVKTSGATVSITSNW